MIFLRPFPLVPFLILLLTVLTWFTFSSKLRKSFSRDISDISSTECRGGDGGLNCCASVVLSNGGMSLLNLWWWLPMPNVCTFEHFVSNNWGLLLMPFTANWFIFVDNVRRNTVDPSLWERKKEFNGNDDNTKKFIIITMIKEEIIRRTKNFFFFCGMTVTTIYLIIITQKTYFRFWSTTKIIYGHKHTMNIIKGEFVTTKNIQLGPHQCMSSARQVVEGLLK